MQRLLIPASIPLLAVPVKGMPRHAPEPRLSMDQARRIALKAARGRLVAAEYEKEKGAWRYSFDIRQARRIHEVGVDANSGRIVENAFEDPRKTD